MLRCTRDEFMRGGAREQLLDPRRIAQRLLERSGYRTLLAANGAIALDMYIEHKDDIAVVLTDMAMPGLCSPTLCFPTFS